MFVSIASNLTRLEIETDRYIKNLAVLSNYAPGGGTMVAFRGRILALGRWNLQMSWCKCPGAPRGQPPGMAADKCIIILLQSDGLP